MKLGDYLKEFGISQAAFAVGLKSDQGHVSDLVTGKVKPTLDSILEIEKLTSGKVNFADWTGPRLPVTVSVPAPPKQAKKRR